MGTKTKRVIKIILATDGSACSKAAVEEVAGTPLHTNVRIVCAYQSTPVITTIDPMGVSYEYYDEADANHSYR